MRTAATFVCAILALASCLFLSIFFFTSHLRGSIANRILHPNEEAPGNDGPLFFLFTMEMVESLFGELRSCGITVYAQQVYDFLSTHPNRTLHYDTADLLIFPPYMAWETNWPVYQGRSKNMVREGIQCRDEVLRSIDSLIGLHGAMIEHGRDLEEDRKVSHGDVAYLDDAVNGLGMHGGNHRDESAELDAAGAGAMGRKLDPETSKRRLSLVRNKRKILLLDSFPFYDDFAAILGNPAILWAKLNALEGRWKPHQGISMPPPAHHVIMPVASLNASEKEALKVLSYKGLSKEYLLTFKGNFKSHPIRRNVSSLHNAAEGIVVVDSSQRASRAWNYVDLMSRSEFALVIRGDVEFSYRFTEVVCSGSIPVLVSDGWIVPFSSLISFENYGVRIPQQEVNNIVEVIRSIKRTQREKLRIQSQRVCQLYLGSVERQIQTMLHVAFSKLSAI